MAVGNNSERPYFYEMVGTATVALKLVLTDYFSVKENYRNGRNTPSLIFENLKPVEIIKKSFEHHLNILKVVEMIF